MKSKIIVLAVLLFCFFQINVNAQMDSTTHAFGVGYMGINTAKARGGEPMNGNGFYISYQYSRRPHWGYGLQFGFTNGTEDIDIYGVPYKNTYDNFSYLFTTKYFFLPKKFKMFVGFNVGGTLINFHSNSSYYAAYDGTKSNGLALGLPIGFYWFAPKYIFLNVGYTPSFFVGSSYMSSLINNYNAGIGYYFTRHFAADVE